MSLQTERHGPCYRQESFVPVDRESQSYVLPGFTF